MKIFFWSAGSDGSSFYRQALPALGLGWRGHRVGTGQQLSLPAVRDCDAVIGARIASAPATLAWQALSAQGVPLVLDLDDDYFNLDPSNRRAYEFWGKDGLRQRLADNMDAASLVTVASQGLAAAMAERTSTPIAVVPNLLPAQYLAAPRAYGDKVTVGWAGSSSTLHELPIIARSLNRLARLARPVQVKLVGCTLEEAGAMGVDVSTGLVSATGWIPDVPSYLKECMAFDIWLAPYRPTPFNQAKFPTKALESSFLGIPLLASPTRPYADWVTDRGPNPCGVTLVRHDHDWGHYLKALTDPDDGPVRRRAAGEAATAAASSSILQSGAAWWESAIQTARINTKREAPHA